MSNARIVERLSILADQLERGEVSVEAFADQLLGHTEALEQMTYARLKEAQMVWAQLRHAITEGDSEYVDREILADWLWRWVASVPVAPPER